VSFVCTSSLRELAAPTAVVSTSTEKRGLFATLANDDPTGIADTTIAAIVRAAL
jgi:hypothetical protein